MTSPRPDSTDTSPDAPLAAPSVRLAMPSEAASIAEVQLRAWRGDPSLAGVDLPTPEEVTSAWWEAIARPPLAELRVLVAVEPAPGGMAVRGFAAVGPSDDEDADPRDGLVAEFIVDPGHRQAGHGSRLVNAAVDTLRADGFTRATWWVRTTDDVLRAFLSEAGWAPDGAHRETGTEDEQTRVKEVRLHTDISADPAS